MGSSQTGEDVTIVEENDKETCKKAFEEFLSKLWVMDKMQIEEFKMNFENFINSDDEHAAFNGFLELGAPIGISFVRKDI